MKMKKYNKLLIILIALTVLSAVVLIGTKRGIPFVDKETRWSIGIYTGESPLNLVSRDVKNPVLSANDVSDVNARFVADPFMIRENNTWYMFIEVLNRDSDQGDIGLATSKDGLNWSYKQIVLDEDFHLSYPYVFKWKNEIYMIPETRQASSIRLYKAVNFPTKWLFVRTILDGKRFADSSILYHDDKWWLFTETGKSDTLSLYYADDLMGSWIEHPKSPIINGDANVARPGGRVTIFDDRIIRFAQDDAPTYGNQLWAFEITELTIKDYKEKEVIGNSILKATGAGWNGEGMHHIDPHQINKGKWIACVDGLGDYLIFGLEH